MKETIMKDYKALSKEGKAIFGDGMQYELNVWYKMEEEIIPCERGYHYFDNIRDIFYLFCGEEYDIYEIGAKGKIIKDEDDDYKGKFVCSEIKLTRKLSEDEIKKYIEENLDILVNDKSWEVRRELVKHGYGLDIFVNDEDWRVRCELAKQGYGLDKLINDKDYDVRCEVARHGYGLDKLINDEDWRVRCEVSKQSYGLDKLINDEDMNVRCELAKQGYGLDKLINDEDYDVRCEVARHGYGLDKLINDEDWHVRYEAKRQLELRNK